MKDHERKENSTHFGSLSPSLPSSGGLAQVYHSHPTNMLPFVCSSPIFFGEELGNHGLHYVATKQTSFHFSCLPLFSLFSRAKHLLFGGKLSREQFPVKSKCSESDSIRHTSLISASSFSWFPMIAWFSNKDLERRSVWKIAKSVLCVDKYRRREVKSSVLFSF